MPSCFSVLYNVLLPVAQVVSAIVVVLLALNDDGGVAAKHWAVFATAAVVFLKAVNDDAKAVRIVLPCRILRIARKLYF